MGGKISEDIFQLRWKEASRIVHATNLPNPFLLL